MVVASFKHFFHARPFITAAVAIWICVTIYLCFKFFNLRSNNEQDLTYQSLLEVITGLEKQVDAQYKTGNTIVVRGIRGMSSEILRRRALQYVREVKYSLVQLDNVNEKINTIKNYSLIKPLKEIKVSVEQLKRHLHEMSTHLQVNIDGIGRVDGMLESRIKYLDILSNELQNELFKLQNPPDCKMPNSLLHGSRYLVDLVVMHII
ncbi:unnamed protein product [Schistosoma turkestanicum]|nr:unnamed protein product [Schistosoma turkestanicum]CAH8489512.1 unnamed protein product [Schistosoma turkestanicum]